MAAENSFDIVCKVDMQEVNNALDQSRREIDTRYDLKGTRNEITLDKSDIVVTAPDEMNFKAVVDIHQSRLQRRVVQSKTLTSANPARTATICRRSSRCSRSATSGSRSSSRITEASERTSHEGPPHDAGLPQEPGRLRAHARHAGRRRLSAGRPRRGGGLPHR